MTNQTSMILKAADVCDFESATKFLGNKNERPLQYETRIRRLGNGSIAIKHYNTDIIVYHPDGLITVKNGGWNSRQTQDRFNTYLPAGVHITHEFAWKGRGAPWTDEEKAQVVNLGLKIASGFTFNPKDLPTIKPEGRTVSMSPERPGYHSGRIYAEGGSIEYVASKGSDGWWNLYFRPLFDKSKPHKNIGASQTLHGAKKKAWRHAHQSFGLDDWGK